MNPTRPTDTAPPPSYQLSIEEFDQKTSQAIRNAPEVDEDGWEVYDPAAIEAAAGNHEPSSSSARVLGSDRQVRQSRRRSSAKALPSIPPLKIRNAEQHPQPEDEDRVPSPPPPFTPTGPPLDGPPFDEVVGPSYSYHEYGQSTPILEPYPPSPRSPSPPRRALPPVQPLRLRPNRPPSSQIQTSSNSYPSRSAISPIPNRTSTIARVEFDPQTAYSPYGGGGANNTHIRADATAFYNRAVASQLTASSAVSAQTRPSSYAAQSGYMERVSSPHGYTPTTWAQQPTSSVPFREQYAPHVHSLSAPATPPVRSPPPGAFRGPQPPVPNSLSQLRWAGSEQQIMQDVYGGR